MPPHATLALGVVHVPSARRKFVVPPPEAGANPFAPEVTTSSSAVAWVPVRDSTSPVPAVVRPRNLAVDTCASMGRVTLLAPMAVVIAVVPDPDTSPDKVMVWFPVMYPALFVQRVIFPEAVVSVPKVVIDV